VNSFTIAGLLVASVVVGLGYTWLGLRARAHLASIASSSDRAVGWLFWWSARADLYDEAGKRLCRIGNFLVVPLVALYAAWYFVLVK
jgi:hypothetical protein